MSQANASPQRGRQSLQVYKKLVSVAGTASREHDVGNGKINTDIRGRSTTEASRFSKTKASRNINVELMGGSAYADWKYFKLATW